MSLQSLVSRLSLVEKKWLEDLEENPDNDPMNPEVPGRDGPDFPSSIALLAICNLANDAMSKGLSPAELDKFLEAASMLEDIIIDRAGGVAQLLQIFSQFGLSIASAAIPAMAKEFVGDLAGSLVNSVYNSQTRPSKSTTPLACFSTKLSTLASDASPELTAFAEARCEILAKNTCSPINMYISDDVVTLMGAGGWKLRSPTLHIERLDRVSKGYAPFGDMHPRVGLAEVAGELCLDNSRSILYIADSFRVKSYSWHYDGAEGSTLPVHTLKSDGFDGALFLRNNGTKLMRSGMRALAVWDVDTLPTHGAEGERVIGNKLKNINTSRDYDEAKDIEASSGTPPTDAHRSAAREHRILAVHRDRMGRGYGLAGIDLEAQKVAARYLGHSARPNAVATNVADPSGFVTAAGDGGVRFYDVRQPVPQFAIDHGEEQLNAALYESIGGQPFIIYGSTRSEQIKVWDVRSRKPMYKLATGNTGVMALAWDARRQTLLAATECIYQDRMGSVHDYRPAKIGGHGREWLEEMAPAGEEEGLEGDDEDDYEDEDEDEEKEEELERMWPDRAWHSETSFGVAYDAGDHMLFRYQFKSDANPRVLPRYGRVSPAGSW